MESFDGEFLINDRKEFQAQLNLFKSIEFIIHERGADDSTQVSLKREGALSHLNREHIE